VATDLAFGPVSEKFCHLNEVDIFCHIFFNGLPKCHEVATFNPPPIRLSQSDASSLIKRVLSRK